MHAQVMAYAVTGAVQIHPSGPHHRTTRQDIQQTASHPLVEHSHAQVYHAFQDSGIVISLPLCQRTERNSPGSVRSAVSILRSRVNQQKTLGADNRTAPLRRHIMRHGGIRSECDYGRETLAQIVRALAAALYKLHGHIVFCNTAADIGLDPVNDLCHSSGILYECLAESFEFNTVLDRLHHAQRATRYRIWNIGTERRVLMHILHSCKKVF